MPHRPDPSRFRRTAVAFAAAAALASPAFATTTAPSIDWDRRIRDELAATGELAGVTAALAADATPAARHARIRVALEQGDLAAARTLLERAVADAPGDASALEQLSRVQEMAGQADAARRSLESAVSAAQDGVARGRLLLRLATLAFDAGRADDAAALLGRAVAADPAANGRAGMIAYVYGQFRAAAGYFRGLSSNDAASRLLEGNAALAFGDAAAAARAYDAALDAAVKPADRAYAIERQIAAARAAGALPALADAWLAEKPPHAERLLPLATVLRELNRVPDLLALWRAGAADPKAAEIVLSDRFVNEVLGAAQSAGRGDDAVAVCRQMLAREPDSWQWLAATARALIGTGKADEADAALRQRLTREKGTPAAVQRLGRLARSLGRDGVALDAADRLTPFGGGNAVAGRLLAASVYDRGDDRTKAAAALAEATDLARRHPVAVGDVVGALEAFGQDQQAIDLLQDALKASPDDAALLGRLASLMLKLKQDRQAVPVLERILRSDASPATRAQAAQRLLEAAKSAKTTDDLVRTLQDRLKAGHGNEQDLGLLVDAQLSLRQFDAAVRTIQETPLLDAPAKLRRLSVMYLRNKKLDQADATLRELAKADPSTARETYERLASVAIERERPGDIAAAIDALRALTGPGEDAIGTMAGVLNRLGRTADAARQYRRLVAISPANADDWLLWSTAMGKTGQAAVARRRLQVLCGEAPTDAVFAIAVDGLLNLNAPPETLAVVRRDALLRLAERPSKMMLYHVVADVSEELGDPAAVVRVTQAAVATGDEERPQNLRQLMDVAGQNGLLDTAVACGRSLLALGDEFPPQLFLQLGERLLIAGRPDEASRAFARATEGGDPDFVAVQTARMLERFDYPAAALDTLRPLADRRRGDLDFRQHLATLAETVGRTGEAYDEYRQTLGLAMRPGQRAEPAAGPIRLFRVGREQGNPLDRPLNGALMTARTPEQAEALLTLLEDRVAELTGPGPATPPPGLDAVTDSLRDAALFLNRPDRADRADDTFARRWPDAQAFKARVVQDRARSGRLAAAYAFAGANGVPLTPALQRYGASLRPAPATLPAAVGLKDAADALPMMMVRGEYDRARATLAAVTITEADKRANNLTPGLTSPFRTLVTAAAALGDDDTAARMTLAWADTFESPQPASRPASRPAATQAVARVGGSFNSLPMSYTAMVASTWRLMPDAARAALVGQIRRRMNDVESPQARGVLALYTLRLSAALGGPVNDAGALGLAAVASQSYNSSDATGQALSVMPVAERPAFLRAAFAAAPKERRLTGLLAVVGKIAWPLDDASADAVIDLASSAPADQAIDWGDWCVARQSPRVMRAIADAVLKTAEVAAPGDVPHAAARAAAAAALANAGDAGRADALAAEALASTALYVPPLPTNDPRQRPAVRLPTGLQADRATMLNTAVAAMSPPARAKAIAAIDAAGPAWTQADGSWRAAVKAKLLAATGDRAAALVALRDGLARDPNDALLVGLYRDRLIDDGRLAELAGLAPRLAGTGTAAVLLRAAVSDALRGLYRWREVPTESDAAAPSPDFLTPLAAGDAAGLATAMRGLLLRLRETSWPGQFAGMNPGGLRSTPAADFRDATPPALFDGFADWPGTADDVLRTLHNDAVGGPAAEWLATLVARVAGTNAGFRDRLLSQLNVAAAAGTCSSAERATVARLARTPGVELPPSLADVLTPGAIAEPAGPDMKRLAETVAARLGSPAAAKWADMNAMNGQRVGGPGSGPGSSAGGPLDPAADAGLVAALRTLAGQDVPAAVRAYDAAVAAGRVSARSIGSRLLGARLRAERGDTAGYAADLDAVLNDWAWQQCVGLPRGTGMQGDGGDLDVTLALPDTPDAAVRDAVADALRAALVRLGERWPGSTDVTRALAAAGDWRAKTAGPQAALPLLEAAKSLAERQGPGEHQLWVADLADRVGQADVSLMLRRLLLEHRCLPAVRIVPLLDAVRATGDVATADRLAADAATYCAEPRLRRLAESRPAATR